MREIEDIFYVPPEYTDITYIKATYNRYVVADRTI